MMNTYFNKTSKMECKSVLNNILKENLNYSINYGNGLSNHLPMTAIAMFKSLGDNDETAELMTSFSERYFKGLVEHHYRDPIIDFQQIPHERRLQFMGNGKLFNSWYYYFRKELEGKGFEKVLEEWLPIFVKGLSGGGGHCLLRTYFCLIVRDELEKEVFEGELAVALAYFGTNYLPLGDYDSHEDKVAKAAAGGTTEIAVENDQVLLGEMAKSSLMNSRLIATQLQVVSWDESFQSMRKEHHINLDFEKTLKRLAAQSIKDPDFSLLHNLTVGQCILELFDMLPYLKDTYIKEAYADFVLSVYYLRRNSFTISSESDISDSITVEDILEMVPSKNNAHSIKSGFSLVELYKRFDDKVFLVSAEAFMNRYN